MKIIETPRDAMQGVKDFIPTELKIKYINTLLRVGFHTIDFGSFVSSKSIPQFSDIDKVMGKLYLHDTDTRLLSIIGNERGLNRLIEYPEIEYIGVPYSISNVFLKMNINSNKDKIINNLSKIVNTAIQKNKKVLVYISMAFGNPYNEDWNIDYLLDDIDILYEMGVNEINISDTIGVSKPDDINNVFTEIINQYPHIEFGFHLHSKKNEWYDRIKMAYNCGVRKFDTSISGIGGCPMTGYELISNLNTYDLLDFCFDYNIKHGLNNEWLKKSEILNNEIFNKYK